MTAATAVHGLKLFAFLKRGWQIESSYKIAFLIRALKSVIPLLSTFFIGKLIGSGEGALTRYGGDYFAFAVIGLAITGYFEDTLRTFADNTRRAQMTGVLEAILSTPTPPRSIVLFDSAFNVLWGALDILVVLTGGVLLGARFPHANVGAVLTSFVLSFLGFVGLGVLAAASSIVFKRGDPVSAAVSVGGMLLAGTYFPVSLLPGWLQTVARILPLTHALEAIRLSFRGASFDEILPEMITLACMAGVLLPLGLWLFGRTVERGRRDGTLLHY